MKYQLVAVVLLFGMGCASSSKVETVKSTNSGATASEDARDGSRVLNKTKCPKNGKIVDGKCTLQVESDDE